MAYYDPDYSPKHLQGSSPVASNIQQILVAMSSLACRLENLEKEVPVHLEYREILRKELNDQLDSYALRLSRLSLS